MLVLGLGATWKSCEFLNGSTTHTNIEQGAWWQVDLGSKKNINEIICGFILYFIPRII
jgi:hypothetical protein